MSDDYSDLSPRQKARLMEQNLQIHNERRRSLGLQRPAESLRTPWDRRPDAAPAPAFWRDDAGLVDPDSRPPSWDPDRRAARYRDGRPPPPPPEAAVERQRLLQQIDRGEVSSAPTQTDPYGSGAQSRAPRQRRLVPQEVFEEMAGMSPPDAPPTAPPPGTYATGYDLAYSDQEYTVQQARLQPPEATRLSPSQKRRLRRQKTKQPQPSRPAPYPLPQDARPLTYEEQQPPPPAPVEPTYPDIPVHAVCDRPLTLQLGGAGSAPTTFYCPLTPYPHPGQPHMVRLQGTPEAPDVFLGWWGPGE